MRSKTPKVAQLLHGNCGLSREFSSDQRNRAARLLHAAPKVQKDAFDEVIAAIHVSAIGIVVQKSKVIHDKVKRLACCRPVRLPHSPRAQRARRIVFAAARTGSARRQLISVQTYQTKVKGCFANPERIMSLPRFESPPSGNSPGILPALSRALLPDGRDKRACVR
jgi:hypothetical protein